MPYEDIFTSVFLLKTELGALLFDTAGSASDAQEHILPFLAKNGVSAQMLKYIFISHNHDDHSGGLSRLMDAFPTAQIVSRSAMLKKEFIGEHLFLVPEDGAMLLGVLRVTTVPGHTRDSIALFDTRTNTLLSGDGLQLSGVCGSGEWAENIPFPAEHFAALDLLCSLPIETILAAHNYYPYGSSAHGPRAVARFLDACELPLFASAHFCASIRS